MGFSDLRHSNGSPPPPPTSSPDSVSQGPQVTTSSRFSRNLRSQFVRKGRLDGSQDIEHRAVRDRFPSFALAVALSPESPAATFTVGHMRDPYVVRPLGSPLSGILTSLAQLCHSPWPSPSPRLLDHFFLRRPLRRHLLGP